MREIRGDLTLRVGPGKSQSSLCLLRLKEEELLTPLPSTHRHKSPQFAEAEFQLPSAAFNSLQIKNKINPRRVKEERSCSSRAQVMPGGPVKCTQAAKELERAILIAAHQKELPGEPLPLESTG